MIPYFAIYMHKRILLLFGLVLLVGFVTRAFAAAAETTGGITRADAVAILVEAEPALRARVTHFTKHKPPLPLFDDIDYAEWYASYVEAAFEAGIITGNSSGLFRPGDLIAEEEAIALAARFQARTNVATAMELRVQQTANWFEGPLNAALRGGITIPSPIRPGLPMNRAAYFAMMTSAGVAHPETIAIGLPKSVAVVAALHYPDAVKPSTRREVRPVVQAAVSSTPRIVQPVIQPQRMVPQQTQPVTQPKPQVSAKNFAISMPSLGVTDLTITHPSDPFTKDGLLAPLKYGVGHLFSYPGKGGKILIYGHSSSYPWDVSDYTKIFRQINKLAVGDKIYVTSGGKQYVYQVSYKQTVPASDMSVYQRGGGEELILYTCWPPDSIKERYLVHAKPIEAVAAR